MSAHEDVAYHLSQAQALLEFAGQPVTPQDALIGAMTHSVIGLLLEIRDQPAPNSSSYTIPTPVRAVVPSSTTDQTIFEAMVRMKNVMPDWRDKLIQFATGLGLKESKDLVETSKRCSDKDWWEK